MKDLSKVTMAKTLRQSFTNVFSYAAGVQKWVTDLFALGDKEIEWTFAHDFAIGEWVSGRYGVTDTMARVRKEHAGNWKAWAQAVAQLSVMSNVHYQLKEQGITGRDEWVEFYHDLFSKERALFYEAFADNDEAKEYLFDLYD
jgi:hypothetical protein